MTFFVLPIVSLTTLVLAGFVLSKHVNRWPNRLFAIFASSVGAWTFAVFLATHPSTYISPLLTARMAFAAAALTMCPLILLFKSLESPFTFPASRTAWLFFALTLAFIALSSTRLIVADASFSGGVIKPQYGNLYPAYALLLLIGIATSIWLSLSQRRSSRGLARLQYTYLALGLLIPGLLAVGTNLLVPLFYRTSRLSEYGPLFSLLMIVIVAHAMVRHHLMDVRVVVRKGVVYVVSFTTAGLLLAGLIVLADYFFATADLGLTSDIVISLTVAVIFHPLKSLIQQMCDHYLYRVQYSYPHIVKGVSAALASLLTLPALLAYIAETITRTMGSQAIAVYLKDDFSPRRYRRAFYSSRTTALISDAEEVAPGNELTEALARSVAPLSADTRETTSAVCELRRLGSDLALPLLDEQGLMGFVLLGPKLSGDAYFSDDVDLLSTLANQAGVAIKNAQLYEQVVLISEYLQNIVGTIESGVIAVNQSGLVTLFNPAAEQITGLTAEAVRGRPIAELPPVLGEPLGATARDGEPRVLPEVELRRGDGSVLPAICLTSPLREPSGALLGAVAVVSDLTPLKQLEMERRRAERLAYFETLAAGIAHEIKNPLVAIKTFAQLLPRKFQDGHFRESFGRVAAREIGRMEHLVDRLRSLAKPGARPQHVVDLRVPITDALELLQPRLEEKGIRTVWAPAPESRPVLGDQPALEQLFLNLFINALEAMPPGGTLAVRLDAGPGPTRVEVDDTGPGIPEESLGKIFDPFVTTKPHGSGLGLAICASIANAHRARLQVANKSGRPGAVFTLEFPAEVMAPTPVSA